MSKGNKYNTQEFILNRRINYTIIRKMWDVFYNGIGVQLVKGYENDLTSLTGTFELSKSKLNSICDGYDGEIQYSSYSKIMEAKTGIPKTVFTGEERIILNEDSIDSDWDNYFTLKDKLSEDKAEAKEIAEQKSKPTKQSEQKLFEGKLFAYFTKIKPNLKIVLPDYKENLSLFLVYHFILKKEKYTLVINSIDDLNHTIELLNKINIYRLELLDIEDLNNYITVLQKQIKKASAVLIYKEVE